MNDEIYRGGGNDPLNLPTVAAAYRKRLLVDGRAFDIKYNIPISQWTRHSIPNWVLVLACLPAIDSGESRTTEEIQSIITDLEYPIRAQSIRNVMRYFMDRTGTVKVSKILLANLNLVQGVVSASTVENGHVRGNYTLGIDMVTLKSLVDSKQFVTYSFNLNNRKSVTLVGR